MTGTAPTIDVADSRVHATYREEALRDLPFQGRNFLGLMAVAPGVTGRGAVGGGAPGDAPDNFSTEKTVDVSANGRNSGGNQFIMDGLNMTSNIIQGVANLSPNPDAIQEMAIQTNTFSVAEGRASSVNVAITTKSGSNSFRGTGSYIFTNEQFWARPFFRTTDFDPFYKHDLSATIGGPILKGRTFFFSSIQPLRSRLTNADTVQTYESPEFVAWARQNFPNSLGTRVLTEHGMENVVTTGVTAHRPRRLRRRLRDAGHPQHPVRPADGGRGPLQAEPVPQRPAVEHPRRPQLQRRARPRLRQLLQDDARCGGDRGPRRLCAPRTRTSAMPCR